MQLFKRYHNLKQLTGLYLLFSFLLLAGNTFAAELQVNFPPQATVENEKIHLADIAEITGSDIEKDALNQLTIAIAPKPGESTNLQATEIIFYIQQTTDIKNINWQGSRRIQITRSGILINKERLQQILAAYLAQNLDKLPRAEIRFASLRTPKPFMLPKGKLTWEVIPSNPQIIGSSSFAIIFKLNEKIIKNTTVSGRLEAMADVVTAAEKLKKGATISANNLKMTRQNLVHLQNPFFAKDDIIGMRTKRTIPSGRVIDRRNIESLPLINKGELVKIFANKGLMLLSASGIAKMDGRKGDIIQVENINSKKLIYCRVNRPGIVTVEF